MNGLDLATLIILVVLGVIFLIVLTLFIAAAIVYGRIKRDIQTTLVNLVKKECTGNIDKSAVFTAMDPKVYNKNNAAAALRACGYLTYSDGCGRPIVLPGPDFTLLARYSGYDTVGNKMQLFAALFYSVSLKILLVCFSATIQISEWQDNFLFHQVPPTLLNNSIDGMLVHQGFYNIYTGTVGGASSLRDNIIAGVNKYLHAGDTILVVGHSLGATLATLCFFDTCNMHPNTVLYTTGSPRVGNTKFAEFMSNRPLNYRLYNSEDIVVNLPFPFMFGWDYTQSSTDLQFSLSLDGYSANHNESYILFLETGITN